MYCSYCAGVLEANQPVCSRCGRPVPGAASPVATAAPVAVGAMPSSVRTAIGLLLISWAVALGSIATLFVNFGARVGFITSVAAALVWLLLILCIWQRQNWARIGILVLVVWVTGNVALVFLRHGDVLLVNSGLALALVEGAMRIYATYLLFRPDSTAWFKK